MRKVLFIVLVALGAAFPGRVIAEQVETTTMFHLLMEAMDQATVDRVLETSAPQFDKTYQQMVASYNAGNVTIEELGGNSYKVTLVEGGVTQTILTDVYL